MRGGALGRGNREGAGEVMGWGVSVAPGRGVIEKGKGG